MNAISFTFPAIPDQVIADLTQTETILAQESVAFARALREKYGPLATSNGFVKLSEYNIGNDNWGEEGATYLRRENKRVKALLASDGFTSPRTSEFAGLNGGSRLFLLPDTWVEITRTGAWSRYRDSPDYWTCDGDFSNAKVFDLPTDCGIRYITDEDVAREYNMVNVAQTLAESLATMAEKLPQRLTRKRALAESLAAITAQLQGVKS